MLLGLLSDIPSVIKEATNYLFWMVILPPVMGVAFVMEDLLVGTIQMKLLRNAAVISTAIFVLAYYFALIGYSNNGLWLSMLLYFVVRPIIGFSLRKRSNVDAHGKQKPLAN